jgi:hypothetical protein
LFFSPDLPSRRLTSKVFATAWFSKMLSAFGRTPEFENLISDTRRYL